MENYLPFTTGQRFGKLVVISRAENNHRGNTQWLCHCDCGNEKIFLGYDLTHGRTTSCGCRLKGTISNNRKDLVGQKYGKLTVIAISEVKKGKVFWTCKCDCGKEIVVNTANLRNGHTQSCGCMRFKEYPKDDLLGQKFGRLLVKQFVKREKGNFYWKCQCDCGNEKIVNGDYLKSKHTQSCGCISREQRYKLAHLSKHGDSRKESKYNRLYKEWGSMIERCSKSYWNHHRYCDRGIKVCDEWRNYQIFKNWALNNGYSDNLTLDRIDNNGNYEPSNCRWATLKQQANNTCKNVYITYQGRTQTMKQWCEELGLNYGMVKARRRYGWSEDKLLIPNTLK